MAASGAIWRPPVGKRWVNLGEDTGLPQKARISAGSPTWFDTVDEQTPVFSPRRSRRGRASDNALTATSNARTSYSGEPVHPQAARLPRVCGSRPVAGLGDRHGATVVTSAHTGHTAPYEGKRHRPFGQDRRWKRQGELPGAFADGGKANVRRIRSQRSGCWGMVASP